MDKIQAVIEMESGKRMVFDLYPDKAPISVANFGDLARSGFYNGLSFHRVVKGWVIQGGSEKNICCYDPSFCIKGEFAANGVDTGLDHRRGALSYAREDAYDTAGTQFFVVHQDAHRLDGLYAAFGMLVEGFDVLDEIASVPTLPPEQENRPLEPQVIQRVYLVPEDCVLPPLQRMERQK